MSPPAALSGADLGAAWWGRVLDMAADLGIGCEPSSALWDAGPCNLARRHRRRTERREAETRTLYATTADLIATVCAAAGEPRTRSQIYPAIFGSAAAAERVDSPEAVTAQVAEAAAAIARMYPPAPDPA